MLGSRSPKCPNRIVNSPFARIKKIQEFLDEKDYLNQDQSKMAWWRRTAHFWILVFRSFQKNRGPVRAGALAYTSLLALVPILAVVVSVSTGFLQKDDEGKTINFLLDKFVETIAPQLNLMQQGDEEETAIGRAEVVKKIMDYIQTINSGTLGVTAGIALVFIAVTVLSTVEGTFNDMWGVSRGRTWLNRIVQYWATITLGPLFIVTAMALTTGAQMKEANTWLAQVPVATTAFSFIVLSAFLTLFYRIMPATKVRWDAAFVGGMTGGFLLQLNNVLNVLYISKVVTYSKIYGGLGSVPIFLVGMYFSWLIILLGAQVAYAYQNKQAYLQEKQAETINQRGREFVAMRLMEYVAEQFFTGNKPPTRIQMSTLLGIPSQLAALVLNALVQSKLMVEVQGDETGYTPARPIDRITVEDILAALRTGHGTELTTNEDGARAVVRAEFEKVIMAEMNAAGAVTLQDIVLRAQSLPKPAREGTQAVASPAPALA